MAVRMDIFGDSACSLESKTRLQWGTRGGVVGSLLILRNVKKKRKEKKEFFFFFFWLHIAGSAGRRAGRREMMCIRKY